MKNIQRERILDSYLKVDKLILTRKNDKTFTRDLVVREDAVCAIVQLIRPGKYDSYLFTKQWRPGALDNVIELVAGTCDVEGEPKEECIKREIIEELGYKTTYVEEIVSDFYVSPGYTTEKMTIFFCQVKEEDKVSEGGGIGNENIEVIEMTEQEVLDHYTNERFNDAKTIIGLMKYFQFKFGS